MKEKIAQAAIQEIRHRGLRFSMRELASRLHMSSKTLYQHFASKEAIIAYLVEKAVEDTRQTELEIVQDASLTVKQKLFRSLAAIPKGYAFTDLRTLQELKQLYPEQWRTMDDYFQTGWDRFRMLAEEGLKEGALRPFDIDLFIGLYTGGLSHFMDRQSDAHAGLPLEKLLEELVRMLLQGILADGSLEDDGKEGLR